MILRKKFVWHCSLTVRPLSARAWIILCISCIRYSAITSFISILISFPALKTLKTFKTLKSFQSLLAWMPSFSQSGILLIAYLICNLFRCGFRNPAGGAILCINIYPGTVGFTDFSLCINDVSRHDAAFNIC